MMVKLIMKLIINRINFFLTLSILNRKGKIKTFVQVGAHDGEMHDPIREFIKKKQLERNFHRTTKSNA